MDLLADNNVYAISLNDFRYYPHNKPGDPYKYDGAHNPIHVDLCKGWVPGKKKLLIHTKSCPTLAGFWVQGIPLAKKPDAFLGKDTVLCSSNNLVLKIPDLLYAIVNTI